MERKMRNNNTIKIVIGVLAGLIVVGGLMIGAFKLGERHERMAVDRKLEAASDFIKEKVDVVAKLSGLSNLWNADTDTIDKDGIGKYIDKVKEIKESISNGEVKEKLENYLSKWKVLEDIYDGKDNEQIMKAFEDIKTSATETAKEIEDILNKNINTTVDELKDL